jgi:glutamate synthase (NADPH/NADH) small chain
MGKPRGFLEYERKPADKRVVAERLGDYREIERHLPVVQLREQAARCMGCGVPFCHAGCPLGNAIPDWNDHAYRGRWQDAITALHATNNFPEITGRVCPAPCEAACVLDLAGSPVTIKQIEHQIADRAWDEGWVQARPAPRRSGRRVAIVGSGPAGLAAAQQFARVGHDVVVYERDARVGGLLRYGIPDFKLDKSVLDRRVTQLAGEGVVFRTGVHVGVDLPLERLVAEHDAVLLASGATRARELPIPGRDLEGVHLAMDFLAGQNRVVSGELSRPPIDARGKRVVILGGGDTGSDCIGTSLRQGAASVLQIELMERPPDARSSETPWPHWPLVLRTSTSHEEGGERAWSVLTRAFEGSAGRLERLRAARVEWAPDETGVPRLREVPGGELSIDADLCLLALGFSGPEPGLLASVGLEAPTSACGDESAPTFATGHEKVFVCGDARRGQSLVVWAIWEGREAARAVDAALSRDRTHTEAAWVGAPQHAP